MSFISFLTGERVCLHDYVRRDGSSFHVSVFNTLLSASLNEDWKRCQLLKTGFYEMPPCLWVDFWRQNGSKLLFFCAFAVRPPFKVSHQPQ